jgi:hypothetical protein
MPCVSTMFPGHDAQDHQDLIPSSMSPWRCGRVEETGVNRAGRVPSRIHTKTYGSAVHIIFQILVGRQMCQGIWTLRGGTAPRGQSHMRQLSRKGRLDGSEQSSQAIEKTTPLICLFPEDTYSRESVLLLVLSSCSALTVGFRFGTAANPSQAAL